MRAVPGGILLGPIRYRTCVLAEVMWSVRGTTNHHGDVSMEWRERGGPSLRVRAEQDGPMSPEGYVGLNKIVRRGNKAVEVSHAVLFCTVPIPIKTSRLSESP